MTKSKPGSDQPGPAKADPVRSDPVRSDPVQSDRASANSPPFEVAMGELESIVRRLEHGGETLDQALEDYSIAIGLLKVCHRKLEQAERRVEILSGVDADGNPISEPVDEVEESMEEKRLSRSSKRTAGRKKTAKPKADQRNARSAEESQNPGLF
jgi:exodeoxyribonuclease VII small subunit